MSKTYIKVIKNAGTTLVEEVDKKPEIKEGDIYFAIDDDYDFGSIDPKDLVLEMYDSEQGNLPGIEFMTWSL